MALLCAVASAGTAQAQAPRPVDLQRAEAAGKVVEGRLGGEVSTAEFTLDLPARQGMEIIVLPVDPFDPNVAVYDAADGTLLAQDDDGAGGLAPRALLYSETRRRVRVEVGYVGGDNDGSPANGGTFRLLAVRSSYRPLPRQVIDGPAFSYEGELATSQDQLFTLDVTDVQGWTVTMSKVGEDTPLDPYLEVYQGDVVIAQPLVSDDDSGGDLNSSLRFVPPQPGRYTIRARGLNSAGGAFRFAAQQAALNTAGDSTLPLGEAVRGNLDASTTAITYQLSDEAIEALAGRAQSLDLTMAAAPDSSVDPYLEVGFQTPLGFSSSLTDDDGGSGQPGLGGLDAHLLIPLEGELSREWLEALRIRASSTTGASGEFGLVLQPVSPAMAAPF